MPGSETLTETTQIPSTFPGLPTDLEELLDRAHGDLQLQMLLIEVAACNEQADFALIARAFYFAQSHHSGQNR